MRPWFSCRLGTFSSYCHNGKPPTFAISRSHLVVVATVPVVYDETNFVVSLSTLHVGIHASIFLHDNLPYVCCQNHFVVRHAGPIQPVDVHFVH